MKRGKKYRSERLKKNKSTANLDTEEPSNERKIDSDRGIEVKQKKL